MKFLGLFLLKEIIIELIVLHMSKDEAINLLRNADLTKKKWHMIKHKKLSHMKAD